MFTFDEMVLVATSSVDFSGDASKDYDIFLEKYDLDNSYELRVAYLSGGLSSSLRDS